MGENIAQFEKRLERVESIFNAKVTYEKKMVSAKELSSMIGFSEKYIYKLCTQEKIPHYRPTGGNIRFDMDEIDIWLHSTPLLKRQKRKTADKTTSRKKKSEL